MVSLRRVSARARNESDWASRSKPKRGQSFRDNLFERGEMWLVLEDLNRVLARFQVSSIWTARSGAKRSSQFAENT
jgi:hypothetical protein